MIFLTPDQESIQQLARDFAETELRPLANALEHDPAILNTIWRRLADLGLTGLQFPEAYGGAGTDYTAYLLVIEELAKVSASVAVTLSVHTTVGILPIFNYGSEAQKKRFMLPLTQGKQVAAFGLTEPDAGSDAAGGQSKAVLNGDEYIVNGSKIFITNAPMADIFVMTAKTEKDLLAYKSMTAFVLERGTPGFHIEPGDSKMGLHGSGWGTLVFDDMRIPVANRLGEPGQGFKIFMNCLDSGRISIGAMALGIAEACLKDATEYAKQRQQFKKPIAEFQAIQFKLANMATEIEVARQLVFHAGRLKDLGLPYQKEAAMAKLWASETSMRCAQEAVQILGGYGYTKEFPVERYFRDAKATELVEGTSQIQRLVIARGLL